MKRIVCILCFCLVFGEFILRYFGFCSAPLYFDSPKFEYFTQPNQKGSRFGNNYFFNEYGHRSDNLSKKKKRILGIGDSVINGGVLTDQDSLATSILSRETNFQILNISAGSWGPDNIAAYLNEYGTYDAEKMILVCSSHDSHDNMDFSPVVGNHPSYPNKQYNFAWLELMDRYIMPRIFRNNYDVNENVIKNGKEFNTGFNSLLKIAEINKMSFIIYLHPEQSEIRSGKYSRQGLEILDWASDHHIQVIDGLNDNIKLDDYRDNIHLNESGQRKLAEAILLEL